MNFNLECSNYFDYNFKKTNHTSSFVVLLASDMVSFEFIHAFEERCVRSYLRNDERDNCEEMIICILDTHDARNVSLRTPLCRSTTNTINTSAISLLKIIFYFYGIVYKMIGRSGQYTCTPSRTKNFITRAISSKFHRIWFLSLLLQQVRGIPFSTTHSACAYKHHCLQPRQEI